MALMLGQHVDTANELMFLLADRLGRMFPVHQFQDLTSRSISTLPSIGLDQDQAQAQDLGI